MSTDAFEQLIDVAAPGGGSYPVQRGHRRGVRSPHTFDAARWPPSSLTSPYAPQGSTTAVSTPAATSNDTNQDVKAGEKTSLLARVPTRCGKPAKTSFINRSPPR